MKNNFNKLVLLFLLLIAGSLQAQSSQNFSETLLGSWYGTGTLFGQTATFKMKWENELDAKFIKLTFENKFKDKSGIERMMHANAYYNLRQNRGYWFDSRGVILPLILEINEHLMIVIWGDENSERGKTTYSISDEGYLNVQDFVYKDNSYQPFGKAKYHRLKE